MKDTANFTMEDLLPGFHEYMLVERRFATATINKYEDGLRWFIRDVGNRTVAEIGIQDFISLKARMAARQAQESRVAGVICAVKSILIYARDILQIPVLDLNKIRLPRTPRRDVICLSNEELDQFIAAIPLVTWEGKPRFAGYRLRALVEVLASSGMRISEALSLNRDSINGDVREARIVGKGNKERTVFFNERSMGWISRYVALRMDAGPALFATRSGQRLGINSAEAIFRRTAKYAGMAKAVTPHIIRHTMATNLLRNGCPIGHIKQLLGHQKLETTCRFYLGVLSDAETKQAHRAYQNFEVAPQPRAADYLPEPPAPTPPLFVH